MRSVLLSPDFFNLEGLKPFSRRSHSADTLLQTNESPPQSGKGVAGTGEALEAKPAEPRSTEEQKAPEMSESEHLKQIVINDSLT